MIVMLDVNVIWVKTARRYVAAVSGVYNEKTAEFGYS